MLERASPRNPSEDTLNKSSTDLILLVACLRNAFGMSSLGIPHPLSVILIKDIPPSFISMVMAVEPASIEFSTSSFTTDEGRSTTSPAAILLIVSESSILITANSISYENFTKYNLPPVINLPLKFIQCI